MFGNTDLSLWQKLNFFLAFLFLTYLFTYYYFMIQGYKEWDLPLLKLTKCKGWIWFSVLNIAFIALY